MPAVSTVDSPQVQGPIKRRGSLHELVVFSNSAGVPI